MVRIAFTEHAAGPYCAGSERATRRVFSGPRSPGGAVGLEHQALGGEAYFITDDTPAIDFLDFMEHVLEPLGYSLPPRSRRVPYPLMLAVGGAMEALSLLCRPFFRFTPTLTRSSVRFVCHDHTFVGDKARRDLDYAPVYTPDDSIARTIEYFRD